MVPPGVSRSNRCFASVSPVAFRLQFVPVKEEPMKADRILVPLDGSELAEAAIARAVEAAATQPSSLMLMRAAEARTLPGTDAIDAQIEAVREAETYLASVKAQLEKQGVQKVEANVWYGPAASAIIEAAQMYKPDLIVMSTHGRSGLGRLIFGSVAESVLRGTTIPILLIRPAGAPVERPAGPDAARPASNPEPRSKREALR
jgi:nucleotide-binding universal stress UspA family protein